MTRSRSLLLLGVALLAGALTAGLSHLSGVDLCYVPTIGLGAFLGVLTLGLVAVLPHEEPRPVARATPPASASREPQTSGAPSPE